MNHLFKNILVTLGKSALAEVGTLVPGANLAIDGITKLFDKNNDNNREGLEGIEMGILQAIRSLSPDKVDNATLVAEGLTELEAGFAKVRQGLKK